MPDRRIAVLGSLNMDLVTRLSRFPGPGETVGAHSFALYPGGKGANQAVACARLGAAVTMYGALGDDALAPRLRTSLTEAGVDVTAVAVAADTATGTADIWVDDDGENRIAIAAGANACVDTSYVDRHLAALAEADYLLLQLEIPMPTIVHLLMHLPSEGRPRVVLDPAPAQPLDDLPLQRLWLLTPNEHELAALTGSPTRSPTEIQRAAVVLIDRTGVPRVLTKAGARGAYLSTRDDFIHIPGFDTPAVDTTAAGDTFNGALVASLSAGTEGSELVEAVRFAHAAAALSVTRPGAQPAMPDRREVQRFLRGYGRA